MLSLLAQVNCISGFFYLSGLTPEESSCHKHHGQQDLTPLQHRQSWGPHSLSPGLVDTVFSVCAHVSGASLVGHLSYRTDPTPLITILEIVAPAMSHSGLGGGGEQTQFGCQPHSVVQSTAALKSLYDHQIATAYTRLQLYKHHLE